MNLISIQCADNHENISNISVINTYFIYIPSRFIHRLGHEVFTHRGGSVLHSRGGRVNMELLCERLWLPWAATSRGPGSQKVTGSGLEEEMATHSSVLAWRIPGTAGPGGLPSMGSHRVGQD